MSDDQTLSDWLKSYPEHKSYKDRCVDLSKDTFRLEKEYKQLLQNNKKLQIKIDTLKKNIQNYL